MDLAQDGGGPAVAHRIRNELSGVVSGPVVQSNSIHGGVHVHTAGAGRPPVPRQVPAPPAHLVGRSRESGDLSRLAARGHSTLMVLCGPGGVGKSALARAWVHQERDSFPDGQLYADLLGFGTVCPQDPGDVLAAFLRALGVASSEIPAALPERAALYRSTTAERRLLVVLDDAYSAAQVRPLVPASTSVVLVTSRRRLVGLIPDGARLLEVGRLPTDASVELVASAVGRERINRDGGPIDDLAEICGGLPIALTMAAARLVARPFLSIRNMVAELADETGRLSALSGPDTDSIRAVFDVSYRDLSSAAARLYRALSLHPGIEFGIGPVAVLTGSAPDETARSAAALDELLGVSLLEEVAEGRFRFHDLLRLHARETAEREETPTGRRSALLAILEHYLAVARRADLVITPYRRRLPYTFQEPIGPLPEFVGRAEALSWLEREQDNLIHAGQAALEQGWPELAWMLADVMWPLLLYVKNYQARLTIDRQGVQAARTWGNAWAEAVMLKRLGRASMRVGAHDDGERHTLAAIERYRAAGDVRGRLDAEEGLATIYVDTGRPELAAQLLQEVLVANRARGDVRSVGLTCLNLASFWIGTGQASAALPLLAEAGEIFAKLGDVDPYNGARVLIVLAAARLGLGDLAAAEQAATEGVERMTELGSANERAEALALLGAVAERRGDASTAGRRYHEAKSIFEVLHSPRVRDLARTLDQLDGYGATD